MSFTDNFSVPSHSIDTGSLMAPTRRLMQLNERQSTRKTGPPKKFEANNERTYKTKEETSKSRNITGTIVVVLLGISVVVPMLQYWGYTSKD